MDKIFSFRKKNPGDRYHVSALWGETKMTCSICLRHFYLFCKRSLSPSIYIYIIWQLFFLWIVSRRIFLYCDLRFFPRWILISSEISRLESKKGVMTLMETRKREREREREREERRKKIKERKKWREREREAKRVTSGATEREKRSSKQKRGKTKLPDWLVGTISRYHGSASFTSTQSRSAHPPTRGGQKQPKHLNTIRKEEEEEGKNFSGMAMAATPTRDLDDQDEGPPSYLFHVNSVDLT